MCASVKTNPCEFSGTKEARWEEVEEVEDLAEDWEEVEDLAGCTLTRGTWGGGSLYCPIMFRGPRQANIGQNRGLFRSK